MSEDKTTVPKLPKLEMPKLAREFLDGFAVTMEAFGKALREFGEAARELYPSIQKRMDEAVKAAMPLARAEKPRSESAEFCVGEWSKLPDGENETCYRPTVDGSDFCLIHRDLGHLLPYSADRL